MQGAFAITPRRLALVVLSSALCVGPLTAQTHAVPPAAAAAAAAATSAPSERWIEHRVAPGERIAEIGDYYGVGSDDIIGWNKLDKERPMIRTGQQLRILTSAPSHSRERASYLVRRGDSWATLAKRFEVTIGRLRDQWNKGEESLRLGARIVVFRIPEPQPVIEPVALSTTTPSPAPSATPAAAVKVAVSVAPVIPPAVGAQSVGRPDRGRIANAAQLPINGGLYTVRNPDHSYGSSHAVALLTRSIQEFRTTGFSGEVVIQDMSRKNGGRFRPHRSHQSGRDVDIRLPLRSGLAVGTIPTEAHQVDWDAAWSLMHAMLKTNRVRFIFLSRPRQKQLYEAALRAGMSQEELATLLQYPRHSKTAVIRHSRGHTKHFHVRFACGPEERSCIDPGFEAEPVEP
jgi:murein endopeptidase